MGIAAPPVSNIGWGVLPLYWRALSSMNAISVLAYRLVATLAAMVALLVAFSVLATAIPLAMRRALRGGDAGAVFRHGV